MEVPNLNYIKELADGSEAFEAQLLQIIKKEFPDERDQYEKSYSNASQLNLCFAFHTVSSQIHSIACNKCKP